MFLPEKLQQTEEISRSLPLTIDTSDAIVTIQDPTDSSQSDNADQQLQDALIGQVDIESDNYSQTFEATLTSSSILLWNIYQANKEIVLGMSAALLVFVAFIVTYLVSKRKSRIMDKAPLIDNEVDVNVDSNRLTIHV